MKKPKPIVWQLVRRKVEELEKYYKNPRTLSSHEAQQLKLSLDRFGMIDKPIVNLDSTIIGGHQRITVTEEKELDVWMPDRQLTEKEVEELNIRLNRNAGEWDFKILKEQWNPNDLMEWGFVESDHKIFQNKEPEPEVKDDHFTPSDHIETDIEEGDIITIGPHRLMCGDSSNMAHVQKLLAQAGELDLVVTDPPYKDPKIKIER